MTKRNIIFHLFFILFLLNSFYSFSDTTNSIRHFNKIEYSAANQNWSVDASPNGFMYFANHSGLLEFDGISWCLYELPNKTILRSVRVASDSLIYSGGYMELGFWKKNGNSLNYHSLTGLADKYLDNNDEFWNISILKDTVYFHSFTKILAYSNQTITSISLPGFVDIMSRMEDKILVAVSGKGIYLIKGDKTVPYIIDSKLTNTNIRFLLPYKTNHLLIGTASQGIYEWDGSSLRHWNPQYTDYFSNNEVNRAYINEKGQLILGTIVNGIIIFDQNGHFISKYNTSNGLQNNTVLDISSDSYGNTWIALDSGIDFISDDKFQGINIETIPGIGSIYDVAIFENKIYLGTNRGLFAKKLNNNNKQYSLVPGTKGQVWDCDIHNNHLFIGFNRGIFTIKDNRGHLISNQAGGFCLREDPLYPGRLICSTYSSLIILKKDSNQYRQAGVVKGFFDLIRYIEFDHLGNIWASHMHKGIYRLKLNNKRDSIVEVKYYGKNSPFKKDNSTHVFKVENRIVFTTEQQLYTYSDLADSIIPYSCVNNKLGDYAKARRIVPANNHYYWFITPKKNGLFKINNNQIELISSIPKQVFFPHETIDDFENILPLSNDKAIICLENGIALFDSERTKNTAEIESYTPIIRKIESLDNQGNIRNIKTTDTKIEFKYHNLHFHYAFPLFTHHPIFFQSLLKGIDSDWSEIQSTPKFNFDRLPAGKYELLVKAIDSWGNESAKHHHEIEILPPWYLTNYAKGGYIIIFLLFIFSIQSLSVKYNLKKERQRLVKREQELIKLKNEKLKNEIEFKSKELANSTMAIIKKNEFLLKLKKLIGNQKEQLGSRYPDKYFLHIIHKIDDNISNKDDWQLFKTNFERAHEQFIQKMKEEYPPLTPKDLRLCALLRMNLSSKEIAPLLGISVRGVENHRYRLRKKMNLEHDENLIDTILKQ